jgi:hypothetical protein
MAEIDDAQKEKEQHATNKRQLDKRTQALDQEDLTLAWDDPEPEIEHTDVE